VRRVVVFLALALVAESAGEWKVAVPDYAWSFPRDHWAHDGYRTEWWYFTGQLASEGDPERRFGYQFTLFRIGVVEQAPRLDSDWAATHAVMGHAAITDFRSKTHVFSEVLYREMPLLGSFGRYPETRIGWSRGPAGTSVLWTLDWNGEGFELAAEDARLEMGFRLETRAVKPSVFQGPNGFSRKSEAPGAASLYYSFTRLETSGDLTLEGERFRVGGESWMDKEFSSSHLGPDQIGWDWFSLQLDDGRELMLYLMRARDGTVDYARGTLVSRAGEPRYLGREAIALEPRQQWTSPESGARYPIGWRIRLEDEGLDLRVRALVDDQENRSALPGGVYYWEGAVSVTGPEGEPLGRGYVELTGYGEGSRPPV